MTDFISNFTNVASYMLIIAVFVMVLVLVIVGIHEIMRFFETGSFSHIDCTDACGSQNLSVLSESLYRCECITKDIKYYTSDDIVTVYAKE